jgi:hypothetical protein
MQKLAHIADRFHNILAIISRAEFLPPRACPDMHFEQTGIGHIPIPDKNRRDMLNYA